MYCSNLDAVERHLNKLYASSDRGVHHEKL
jgi:hypothetical protein